MNHQTPFTINDQHVYNTTIVRQHLSTITAKELINGVNHPTLPIAATENPNTQLTARLSENDKKSSNKVWFQYHLGKVSIPEKTNENFSGNWNSQPSVNGVYAVEYAEIGPSSTP